VASKTKRWHALVLAVSGLMGAAVGGYLLIAPVAFRASYGIVTGSDPNELSETRAPGGVLLAFGIAILFAVAARRMMRAAAGASAILYLSWGLSRVLSAALDGVPSASLVVVGGVELAIGAASAAVAVSLGRDRGEPVAV
jgi:hypothetical protein